MRHGQFRLSYLRAAPERQFSLSFQKLRKDISDGNRRATTLNPHWTAFCHFRRFGAMDSNICVADSFFYNGQILGAKFIPDHCSGSVLFRRYREKVSAIKNSFCTGSCFDFLMRASLLFMGDFIWAYTAPLTRRDRTSVLMLYHLIVCRFILSILHELCNKYRCFWCHLDPNDIHARRSWNQGLESGQFLKVV
jgi:hypothetical protein